jgi:Cof subfamily protein (haloacid dehalogenase superfamily)
VTRLLATDLDGTMISRDGRGAREARAPFARLQSRGVQIAIATGRMVQSAAQILAETGVESGHIIALNGAELWRYPLEQRALWQRAIDPGTALRAVEICLRHGAEVQGYVEGDLRILQRTAQTEAYARRTRVASHLVDLQGIAASPQKLLALLPPDATGVLIEDLSQQLGGSLDCFRSEPNFVEIVPPGVHKGVALKALAEILGMSLDEVAAAGDAENDVEMLRTVGRPFAPETAAPAVRALDPELGPPPPDLIAAIAEAILQ